MKTIRIVVALGTLSAGTLVHAAPQEKPGMLRRFFKHVLGEPGETQSSTENAAKPATIGSAPRLDAHVSTQKIALPAHAAVVTKTARTPEPELELATELTSAKKTTTAPKPTFPSKSYRSEEASSMEYSWKAAARAKNGYEQLPADKRAHVDALLKQTQRPTLAQLRQTMKAAYGDTLPTENPFGSAPHVKEEAPLIADMVAQLEHAFPGGQWLPLGRDAVLIADALDGFYGAIGQPSRVKRLDMSGLSLPHYRNADKDTYEADRPMIYGFLKSNGLDLANAKTKAPYVMIDVTSYSPTSQSTQLMRSTYRTWVKDFGGDPKALYDRVNFVGTPMGGHVKFISETKDIDKAKDEIRSRTNSDGPPELLYLGGNMHKLTYTSAWHRDFTKMYKKADGTITADVGEQSSTSSKEAVLAELFEVERLTTSPAFLQKVQKLAADKYGYEFPLEQTEKLVRLQPKAASSSPVAAAQSETGYMRALKQRLPGASNKPEVAAEFVRDLAGMWARKSVSKHDVKEAIREIQRHVDVRSGALDTEMQAVYTSFPGFRAVVERALRS